jgi:hypothetical protein
VQQQLYNVIDCLKARNSPHAMPEKHPSLTCYWTKFNNIGSTPAHQHTNDYLGIIYFVRPHRHVTDAISILMAHHL